MSMIINPYRFAAAGGDPSWSGVSLLIGADGVDGSTTILDESIVAATLTSTGGAQIDTAKSKFGGSSVLFNSSGRYLSAPVHSGLDFGSGDFTIEFWGNWTTVPSNSLSNHVIAAIYGANAGWAVIVNTAGVTFQYVLAPSTVSAKGGAFTPVADTWYHIAICRFSNTLKIYIDGVSVHNTSLTGTINAPTGSLCIGNTLTSTARTMGGHMDEIRITKGVGRYPAAFTPPTAAFPRS